MGRIGVVAAQQLFRHPGTGDNYAIISSQSFVFRDEKNCCCQGALPGVTRSQTLLTLHRLAVHRFCSETSFQMANSLLCSRGCAG